MRYMFTLLMVVLMIVHLFIPVSTAAPAVTAEEWEWIEAAEEQERATNLSGAMDYWSKLVSSLKGHNYDACGNYAQKLARALDAQKRYTEAIVAFEDEFFCWGQFPDRSEWTLWDRRRVEQIRPEIRAFVARPTTQEPSRQLAKHEPAFGTLLGGTIDKDVAINSDPARVAFTYGKSYAIVLAYAHWNEALPTAIIQNSKAVGVSLQVAWEPDAGLDAVRDDSYTRSFARSLHAYGYPVFLRFGAEMNGSWVAWYGNPKKYRETFALIARIMHEEAPNVAMVWSPNYVGDDPMDVYYPGDDWVDWVGINLYHEAYFNGNPTASQMMSDIFYQGKRSNPLDKVKEIYERYAARKPIILSETGFGWATRHPFEDHSQWAASALERFLGYMPLLYPRIKAFSYFNVDFQAYPTIPSTSHYVLSSNKLLVDAYKKAIASDWYLSSRTDLADYFWRPLEQATPIGLTRIATYVNLGDRGVSRVDYLLDGTLMASATALPWEVSLNLDQLSGQHVVTVQAYDAIGKLGIEREYPFDASAIRVEVNGRYLDFDQPPVILDGRALVPARMILEALGAEVTWEAASQTVVAQMAGHELRLQVDNPVPTRDGTPLHPLDVPAQIIRNRTLIPARFVAETYGLAVKWEPESRTIRITSIP